MSGFSTDIELDFDDATGRLRASIVPSSSIILWSQDKWLNLINEKGYSALFFHPSEVERLLADAEEQTQRGDLLLQEIIKKREKEAAENTSKNEDASEKETLQIPPELVYKLLKIEETVYEVAERKDAEINILISEDEMKAYLTIQPPFGGQPADEHSVSNAINAAEISYGLMKGAIATGVESSKASALVEDLLIAKGVAPKKGKDSIFKKLVDEQVSSGPTINEKGVANYRDINEFIIIESGTELMRRMPPAVGKNGTNVFGKMVPAEAGELLPFSGTIDGSMTSPQDSNLLVATIKGHPLLSARGVSVDPTLTLKGVNLASGNIDFDGSVLVKGDVEDGMRVKASGDVTVGGVVGKATIIAAGDVSIGQGLIGGIKSEEDRGDAAYGAHIQAGCSVTAMFATCAKINAKNTIALVEYASHCDLYADEQVLIGQRSGKGTLIGGTTRAFKLVAVKKLGTPGSVPTVVRVGAEPDTLQNYHKITNALKEKRDIIEQLNESILRVKTRVRAKGMNKEEQLRLDKFNEVHHQVQKEVDVLVKDELIIKTLLMKSKKARVVVNQQVYQNAEVHILGSRNKASEDRRGGTYRFETRKVVLD